MVTYIYDYINTYDIQLTIIQSKACDLRFML